MYSVKYYKKQNIKQINDKCGLLHVSTHLIEFILSSSASFDLNNTARIAYLFCIPLFTLLHLWEFVNTIFYVYQIPLSVDGPHMCVCVCVYIYIYVYVYIYIYIYTGWTTRYRTRHFFNNSNTNEDIATKFEQE